MENDWKSVSFDKVKEMYKSGKSLSEIGRIFDVSAETVKFRLKKHNVETRSKSEAMKLACKQGKINNGKFDKEEIEEIWEEYKSGKTPYELAEEWECSHSTIRRSLRREGYELRSSEDYYITKEIEESEDRAWIIGVIYGDGSVCEYEYYSDYRDKEVTQRTVGMRVKDRDFAKRFSDILEDIYGQSTFCSFRDYWVGETKREVAYKDLIKFQRMKKERIPNFEKESFYGAFLRGLFDSDGGVYCLEPKRKSYAQLSSSITPILRQVKEKLEDMGIKTHLFSTPESSFGGDYRLRIANFNNLIKFREKVGFTMKRKVEELRKVCEEKEASINERREKYERAKELSEKGYGPTKISKRVGIPYTTVWFWTNGRTSPKAVP